MRRVETIDTRVQNWAVGVGTLPIGFQDFWITAIVFHLLLYKTDGGGGTPYQDWLARSITAINIADGGRQYAMMNGNPDLRGYYWNYRQILQGRYRMPNNTAGSQVFQWDIPFIFSPEPLLYDDQINWWDARVGIRPSAGLSAQITFAAAASLGNTITIGSGTWYATYYGIIPEAGDTPPAFYPQWYSNTFLPQQTGGGLQVKNPINPGPYYRRTSQMLRVGTSPNDLRSNGETWAGNTPSLPSISEVGITTADNRNPIYHKTWQKARLSQSDMTVADDNAVAVAYRGAAAAYAAATVADDWNVGVWHDDWARYLAGADPVFGQNSAGKANNWLSTAYSVDVNTNVAVDLVHQAYMQY